MFLKRPISITRWKRVSYLITQRRRKHFTIKLMHVSDSKTVWFWIQSVKSLTPQFSTTCVDLGSFLFKRNPTLRKHCCWKDRTGQEREWDNAIPVTSSLLFHHYKWQGMKQEAHFPSWKPSRLHLQCCWEKGFGHLNPGDKWVISAIGMPWRTLNLLLHRVYIYGQYWTWKNTQSGCRSCLYS